ncbi:MAG: hypothetical protein RRZ85_00075 [Gordonibacter sp.]|uniref:hypothetical protein n=1 Tax=Gordonibacter sp. TaxID=1968902 RepID=UPI002FC9D549
MTCIATPAGGIATKKLSEVLRSGLAMSRKTLASLVKRGRVSAAEGPDILTVKL